MLTRLFRAHTCRFWGTLLLTVLYCGIAMAPLAPLALKSDRIAHAITGECSGNCEIDGCPLESRINRTCCCWQKKNATETVPVVAVDDCCDNAVVQAPVKSKTDCCPSGRSAAPLPKKVSSCCASGKAATVGETGQEDSRSSQPVFKCNPPCGNGKSLAFSSGGSLEIMPYFHVVSLPVSSEGMLANVSPGRLISFSSAPPDPPPKLV